MVSLIVEASNGVCSIACFEEKNILAEKNFVCSNNLSAVILEEIENCLKEANKKKADLKRELSINEAYYKKLVVAGLREVILEEGDKTVWVSKKQLEQLMDQLAE